MRVVSGIEGIVVRPLRRARRGAAQAGASDRPRPNRPSPTAARPGADARGLSRAMAAPARPARLQISVDRPGWAPGLAPPGWRAGCAWSRCARRGATDRGVGQRSPHSLAQPQLPRRRSRHRCPVVPRLRSGRGRISPGRRWRASPAAVDGTGDEGLAARLATSSSPPASPPARRRPPATPSAPSSVLALHGLLHLLGFDHERDGGAMARTELRLRRRAACAKARSTGRARPAGRGRGGDTARPVPPGLRRGAVRHGERRLQRDDAAVAAAVGRAQRPRRPHRAATSTIRCVSSSRRGSSWRSSTSSPGRCWRG